MDFGKSGNEFWHTWWPRGAEELNSPAFKSELQEVVDELRLTVLKNRFAMERFCYERGGKIDGGYVQNYGYIVETEHYRYLYCAEIEGYPEEYFGGDAPAIAAIPIDSIQYFRVEGSTCAETKISGGKVTQSRYTGKIKQTELKSNTVYHDTRIVKMSVLVNGAVKFLDFEYSAFDILCALIPEKEHK